MFKVLSIAVLVILSFQENSASILPYDDQLSWSNPSNLDIPPLPEISSKWEQHIMDFIELIDIDKVLAVAMGYLTDPEVLNFVTFILSDDFKKLVWDFESMAEFIEVRGFIRKLLIYVLYINKFTNLMQL